MSDGDPTKSLLEGVIQERDELKAELETHKAAVEEMRQRITNLHDRLLRGDTDVEILSLLKFSWGPPTGEFVSRSRFESWARANVAMRDCLLFLRDHQWFECATDGDLVKTAVAPSLAEDCGSDYVRKAEIEWLVKALERASGVVQAVYDWCTTDNPSDISGDWVKEHLDFIQATLADVRKEHSK